MRTWIFFLKMFNYFMKSDNFVTFLLFSLQKDIHVRTGTVLYNGNDNLANFYHELE